MRRRIVLGAVLVVACVGALVVVGDHVVAIDRETGEARLAEARGRLLAEAARGLRANLATIGDDLALATTVATRDDATAGARGLDAIADVKRSYAWIDVVQAGGGGRIASRRSAGIDGRVVALATPVIAQLETRAAAVPGELAISPGLSAADDPAAWYRVVARGDLEHRAVAVAVVDMRRVMAPSALLRDDGSRLLVLSAHAVPAPTSDASMSALVRDVPPPAIADLLAAARAGRATTAEISADAARSLGLADAPAIVNAAPIAVDAGTPWILLDATSTASLVAAQRALVVRGALVGVAALAVGLAAAVLVVRRARRDAAMRERVRHLEQAIRAEKLATAGQLAAGIAHEIGTPLNVARGRAELALTRLGDDHAESDGQRTIVAQIDQVTVLIRQLLDYVRLETATRTTVDVAGTVHSVVGMLATHATAHRVSLAPELADGSASSAPMVLGDPAHVQQIVVNLVLNAIDACAPGGHVVVRTRVGAHGVALEVSDDGHGIPADQHAIVFDPFFTTKKRGQGTGLGLWIVAQLARAHGAEVELTSAPDAGATFRVVWPRAETTT